MGGIIMPVVNKLIKQVDLPVWEWMRFAPAATSAISAMCTADDGLDRFIYYMVGVVLYRYDTWSDCWIQLTSANITPATFLNLFYTKYGGSRGKVISTPANNTLQVAAGQGLTSVGSTIRIISGTGAGQERTITGQALAVQADSGFCTTASAASISDSNKKWKYNQWAGYQCRINFGTGAGQIRRILYNDTTTLYFNDTNYCPIDPWNNTGFAVPIPVITGATPSMYVIESSVITVNSNWTVNPDYTSRFAILSGCIYALSSLTTPFYSLQYYNVLMDAWYTRTTPTGMVLAAFGTDSSIERTGEVGGIFDSGTASGAGGVFTLPDTTKTWTVDRWRNYQIEITGGTGIGQRRRIVCNTATLIEVAARWDTTPQNDSTYKITGNRDEIYWVGNAKSALLMHDVEADLPVQCSVYDDGLSSDMASKMSGWKQIAVTSMTRGTTGILTINPVPPAKGNAYKVGDILTVSDGSNGKVIVETISTTGAVETISVVRAGTGYTVATHATTGGSGNGACTVAVTANATVGRIVTPVNHFYKIGDTVTLSGAVAVEWNTSFTIIGVDSLLGFDVVTTAAGNAAALNSNSATLIVDCTKNWVVNEHTGKIVQSHLVGLTGAVVARRITSNTATTITVATITTAMANGTGRYIITDISAIGRDEQYKVPTLGNEGHASAGNDTTITDASKNWFGNQWAAYRVRIIAGTGRGYEGTISANTATSLTVGSIGAVPDATTHYIIMDTFGQCTTGSATQITDTAKNWLYVTTTSQWSGKSVRIIAGTGFAQEALCTGCATGTANTLTVANTTAPVGGDSVYQIYGCGVRGAGIKLLWLWGLSASIGSWATGKYMICPRGGITNQFDTLDITTEKYIYGMVATGIPETFTTGSMFAYDGADSIYAHKDATGRVYKYDCITGKTTQAGTIPYGHGVAIIGNRMEIINTTDGFSYLYMLRHTGTEFWRCLQFW
jgi:hypothetical protein